MYKKLNRILYIVLGISLLFNILILNTRYIIEFKDLNDFLAVFLILIFLILVILLSYFISKLEADFQFLFIFLFLAVSLLSNFLLYNIIEIAIQGTRVYENDYIKISKLWHKDELINYAYKVCQALRIDFKNEFVKETPEKTFEFIKECKRASMARTLEEEQFSIFKIVKDVYNYICSWF
jgi:hypothetical protein